MKHPALLLAAAVLAGCTSVPKPASVDFAQPRRVAKSFFLSMRR